jgi:hypothetical protein
VTQTGARPPDQEHDPRLLARLAGEAARPYVGWLFMGVGALLILLGYIGVSGESLVAKQLPYLVSGGIGGVLLAVIGAYFLGTEELRKDSGRLERLERQVSELHAALLSRPDAPRLEAPSSNGSSGVPTHVVVVESGETFHRPGCSLADGKAQTELTPAEASHQGLRPCPVCAPAPAVTG